jgi:hypothetical protein
MDLGLPADSGTAPANAEIATGLRFLPGVDEELALNRNMRRLRIARLLCTRMKRSSKMKGTGPQIRKEINPTMIHCVAFSGFTPMVAALATIDATSRQQRHAAICSRDISAQIGTFHNLRRS